MSNVRRGHFYFQPTEVEVGGDVRIIRDADVLDREGKVVGRSRLEEREDGLYQVTEVTGPLNIGPLNMPPVVIEWD